MTPPLSDLRAMAEEAMRLDGEASPGPWLRADEAAPGDATFAVVNAYRSLMATCQYAGSDANAAFIARSRELLPALARALMAIVEERDRQKWGHVRQAIDEMRGDEKAIEDATAKRIAEWLRSGEAPVAGPARLAECVARGEWRKP